MSYECVCCVCARARLSNALGLCSCAPAYIVCIHFWTSNCYTLCLCAQIIVCQQNGCIIPTGMNRSRPSEPEHVSGNKRRPKSWRKNWIKLSFILRAVKKSQMVNYIIISGRMEQAACRHVPWLRSADVVIERPGWNKWMEPESVLIISVHQH